MFSAILLASAKVSSALAFSSTSWSTTTCGRVCVMWHMQVQVCTQKHVLVCCALWVHSCHVAHVGACVQAVARPGPLHPAGACVHVCHVAHAGACVHAAALAMVHHDVLLRPP